ncbi:PPE domain-containing protein [Rhodococcus spongiicola]|uniref:PPE domain-containing protein n=1 Tax=Rhodococcus spongiicola TaxID=2487352 RepID=A0A3S3BIR5_9NOCA|nr:PPE domain-containing protein [Rhodococcus spongiicola]RVW02254.1 PPE domain-containing protein [Rhodococcus spongiicola]
MAIGVTGVVWIPRGATVNSTALTAGAGPVPLSGASSAWTAVAESFVDASATLTRVMQELRTGWSGVAADAALARLAPFNGWAQQSAALAAQSAAKASAEAAAYTTAALAMPSLPEITAVKTAKTAAYATGGALTGAAAAAEAADRAMDIRAGLVMEAYEAASSSMVATPETFAPPPPLTNGSTVGLEAGDPGEVARRELENDFRASPVDTIAAAATSFTQNPAVANATTQVGTAAGMVSTATSAASDPGGAGLGGNRAATPTLMANTAIASAGTVQSAAASAGRDGAPAAPRAAGFPDRGRVALPDGWAQAGRPDGLAQTGRPDGWAQAGRSDGAVRPGGSVGGADAMRADASATARNATPVAGAPVGANRGDDDAAESDRSTPGYLRDFEHFSDGRTVIPSVIGAHLPEDGR